MTTSTHTRTPAARAELRALRFGDDLDTDAAQRMAAIDLEGLPEGWIIGRPFRCLAAGAIYQRVESSRTGAGEMRGAPITPEHLASIVRAFEAGEEVPINREHRREAPEGTVLAAWLVDGGQALAVLPAYTAALAAHVSRSSGCLWSSPEIAWGDTHDPASGERLGSMLMDGLAITATPAQKHTKIDRVRLGADAPTTRATLAPNEETDMELEQFMTAVLARFDALDQKVAALEAAVKPAETAAEEPAEDEGDKPTEEKGDEKRAEMAALKAEVAALKADAAKARAEKLAAERAHAVRELLTSGRITPAEQKAAEAVAERGGVELLS
ncbi:MAG: hypothetical protein KC583_03955, partial [Myxococcales bacterium]|nr:hypothetical protein [Myxococcales bacterium]